MEPCNFVCLLGLLSGLATTSAGRHRSTAVASAANPEHQRPFYFIHIPKAGGSTFEIIIHTGLCLKRLEAQHHPHPEVGCKHCYESLKQANARKHCGGLVGILPTHAFRPARLKQAHTILIVRNPVDRLVSGFYYHGWRHNPNSEAIYNLHRRASNHSGTGNNLPATRPRAWPFEEYQEMTRFRNIATRMLSVNENCFLALREGREQFNPREPECAQVNGPGYAYGSKPMTAAMAEVAVKRMKEMFFVGISEEMELSGLVLGRELGVQVPLSLELLAGHGSIRAHKTAAQTSTRTESEIRMDPSGVHHRGKGSKVSEAERESHKTDT